MATAAEIAKTLLGITGGNDEEATVKTFLDTGFPPLNHAMSGTWDSGIAGGRMIEISGPPSAGKTAIATAAMAMAQRMGGIAGFNDHERSFSFLLGEKLGLDTKNLFIYKKPETFEESITFCVQTATKIRDAKLIPAKAPIAWVFDSLAAMVPYSILYDSKGKPRDPKSRNMKDNLALAAAVSAHFPALAQKAEDLGICVIILNQLRTKPGVMYGDPIYTPGGDGKEYYFSQRMRLGAKKIKAGTEADAEIIGMEVTGKMIKNKVCRPFQKATWRFMFQKDGSGKFDVERSLVEFLNGEKLLTAGKPGYVVWDGKQITREALARLIEAEGPKGLAKLKALLPAKYEPPVVAEVELEEPEAA